MTVKFEILRDIEQDMWQSIKNTNTNSLRKIVVECDNASSTNCSWSLYRISKVVREMVTHELERREMKEETKDKPKSKKGWGRSYGYGVEETK